MSTRLSNNHFSPFFVAAGSDVSAMASTCTGASPFTRTVPTMRARSWLESACCLSLDAAIAGCCARGARADFQAAMTFNPSAETRDAAQRNLAALDAAAKTPSPPVKKK